MLKHQWNVTSALQSTYETYWSSPVKNISSRDRHEEFRPNLRGGICHSSLTATLCKVHIQFQASKAYRQLTTRHVNWPNKWSRERPDIELAFGSCFDRSYQSGLRVKQIVDCPKTTTISKLMRRSRKKKRLFFFWKNETGTQRTPETNRMNAIYKKIKNKKAGGCIKCIRLWQDKTRMNRSWMMGFKRRREKEKLTIQSVPNVTLVSEAESGWSKPNCGRFLSIAHFSVFSRWLKRFFSSVL